MVARRLKPLLRTITFAQVWTSPLQRARETCELAGFGGSAKIDDDLKEWNYGDYEGLTGKQIQAMRPGWLIFNHGCPNGESPMEVGARVDRVIARIRSIDGDVALFSHGHLLRTFAVRWLGLSPENGSHFLLDTSTVTVLSYYRDIPAVKRWNAPITFKQHSAKAPRAQEPGKRTLVITRDRYDAVLFDMDGVVTDTAGIHAVCWKTMFDEYLQKWAAQNAQPFRPFDIEADYKLYVDGKPRYLGVRDFLKSRGIILPDGYPGDSPSAETICGLGNRKNELVNARLAAGGAEAYPGTVAFAMYLRRQGIKTAIVTSSQNCQAVLKSAQVGDLFDVRVDGDVIASQHLAGKPAPDSFLKAAEMLAVKPQRAVVIEDALSGVKAGAQGGFGLVIGVARKNNANELKVEGAHIVVNDLAELLTWSLEQPVRPAA
jgi:beta-phosphoglucomutase family hydrolase